MHSFMLHFDMKCFLPLRLQGFREQGLGLCPVSFFFFTISLGYFYLFMYFVAKLVFFFSLNIFIGV